MQAYLNNFYIILFYHHMLSKNRGTDWSWEKMTPVNLSCSKQKSTNTIKSVYSSHLGKKEKKKQRANVAEVHHQILPIKHKIFIYIMRHPSLLFFSVSQLSHKKIFIFISLMFWVQMCTHNAAIKDFKLKKKNRYPRWVLSQALGEIVILFFFLHNVGIHGILLTLYFLGSPSINFLQERGR